MALFIELPGDVLLEILFHLVAFPTSMLALQLTCKHVNGIIQQSPLLQYAAALSLAGATDSSGLSCVPPIQIAIQDKLNAIKSMENNWALLRPSAVVEEVVSPSQPYYTHISVASGHCVLVSQSTLSVWRLPSGREFESLRWKEIPVGGELRGAALSDKDDLIVAAAMPSSVSREGAMALELFPIQMSTGKAHPSAAYSSFAVPLHEYLELNPAESALACLDLVLSGARVVLSVKFWGDNPCQQDIFVFNWMTSALEWSACGKICGTNFSDPTFLTESTVILLRNDTFELEVHYIAKGDIQHSTALRLGLPELIDGRFIWDSLKVIGGPSPGAPVSSTKSQMSKSPVCYAAEDAVLTFHLTFNRHDEDPLRQEASLVVHRSSIVSIWEAHLQRSLDGRIPWAEWGPPCTRWFDFCAYGTGIDNTGVYGQRLVLPTRTEPLYYFVMDFNPHNTQRTKARLDSLETELEKLRSTTFGNSEGLERKALLEDELSRTWVVFEKEELRFPYNCPFKVPPVGSLPYTAAFSREPLSLMTSNVLILGDDCVLSVNSEVFGPDNGGTVQVHAHCFS